MVSNTFGSALLEHNGDGVIQSAQNARQDQLKYKALESGINLVLIGGAKHIEEQIDVGPIHARNALKHDDFGCKSIARGRKYAYNLRAAFLQRDSSQRHAAPSRMGMSHQSTGTSNSRTP